MHKNAKCTIIGTIFSNVEKQKGNKNMDKIKEFWESFDETTRKALCIAISIIMLFGTGNFIGSLTSINHETAPAVQQQPTEQSVQVNATVTPEQTTTAAPQASDSSTSAPQSSTGTLTTKDEIVALFNTAVNKVKTDATKVVKNYENRDFDSAQSVIPSALNSLASSLMDKYLTDDTQPIEYATKEDITANYPVPGQSYSSQITAADVADATCNDNGTEYEVTLKLATSVNPVTGVGVGAVCDVLEAEEISSNEMVSSILKEFTVTYSDCVIKCKIDKATSRVTWANYYTPLTIDALASIVVATVDAKVVLSFEKDYTITY